MWLEICRVIGPFPAGT